MESLWNIELEEKDIPTPAEILEEQCRLLNEITKGYVIGKVVAEQLQFGYDFNYSMYFASTYLPGFKYSVVWLRYNIDLYPCKIELARDVYGSARENFEELINSDEFKCSDIDDYKRKLSIVLNCDKVKNVISSIMNLARKAEKAV